MYSRHGGFTDESLIETYCCRFCFQRFINFEDYRSCLRRHERPELLPTATSAASSEATTEAKKQGEEEVLREDELGTLVYVSRKPLHQGAIIPSDISKSGFSLNSSFRNSPGSLRPSLEKGGFSFKSPKSYESAYSTFSSYKTAPIVSSRWGRPAPFANPGWERAHTTNDETPLDLYDLRDAAVIDYADLTEFVDCIIAESIKFSLPTSDEVRSDLKVALIRRLHDLAYTANLSDLDYEDNMVFCKAMSEDLCAQIRKALPSKTPHHLNELKIFVLGQLRQFVKTQGKSHSISAATLALVTGTEVFSSEWLDHLRSRGILMNPEDELNWSGRGQHVEYTAKEEKDIPLRAEKILGHSATAIVESVMCRRIRLARKRIRCSRKLSKEDAITEVEHLQRLQHSHIVRVVGTYTLKKDLAILLYPAAEWNLEEFMDDTIDAHGEDEWQPQSEALKAFFGCLAHTIRFLHRENVKHMDIKPKNILVRPIEKSGLDDKLGHKVYIADFGIARAYQSAAEVETDSPTSYTRTYAAPEVVDQDKRGFSADIFSLGCVYMEMLATLLSKPAPELNEKLKLQGCRRNENGDSAYYANIASVLGWYMALSTSQWESLAPTIGLFDEGLFHIHMPRMIEELPKLRPDARSLSECTRRSRCSECGSGPEPFEAAKMSPT